MLKIPVVYSPKQVAVSGSDFSPSAHKPSEMLKFIQNRKNAFDIEIVEPEELTFHDFARAHDPQYVKDILARKRKNGFGTYAKSVVDSLPFTNGAMYTAAKRATKDIPAAALVSGFHHAGYSGFEKFGYFCTFNGLMIAGLKLLTEGYQKIAIIDADMHWGNGTDDILPRLDRKQQAAFYHYSFGRYFNKISQADAYFKAFDDVEKHLNEFKPDVILYQSGADTHKDDPSNGILTTHQMFARDFRMFAIAKGLGIPLAWDLAGGYQQDENGNIDKVLRLHYNTFRACNLVYKDSSK